jgi:hypothetical protein
MLIVFPRQLWLHERAAVLSCTLEFIESVVFEPLWFNCVTVRTQYRLPDEEVEIRTPV